jgi:hypothetical protein
MLPSKSPNMLKTSLDKVPSLSSYMDASRDYPLSRSISSVQMSPPPDIYRIKIGSHAYVLPKEQLFDKCQFFQDLPLSQKPPRIVWPHFHINNFHCYPAWPHLIHATDSSATFRWCFGRNIAFLAFVSFIKTSTYAYDYPTWLDRAWLVEPLICSIAHKMQMDDLKELAMFRFICLVFRPKYTSELPFGDTALSLTELNISSTWFMMALFNYLERFRGRESNPRAETDTWIIPDDEQWQYFRIYLQWPPKSVDVPSGMADPMKAFLLMYAFSNFARLNASKLKWHKKLLELSPTEAAILTKEAARCRPLNLSDLAKIGFDMEYVWSNFTSAQQESVMRWSKEVRLA